MSIGKAIRLCRTQRGLSQPALAERAGISTSYLSLLERDKRDPAFSTLEAVANALCVPMVVLTFLASGESEIAALGSELREKLSYRALEILRAS